MDIYLVTTTILLAAVSLHGQHAIGYFKNLNKTLLAILLVTGQKSFKLGNLQCMGDREGEGQKKWGRWSGGGGVGSVWNIPPVWNIPVSR